MSEQGFQDTLRGAVRAVLRALREVDVSLVAFVASLCVLSFVYGVAVMKLRVFPYAVLNSATDALTAWRALEDETLMNGATLSDDAGPRPAIAHWSEAAGEEAVLVTGGPYQLMEECPRFGCLAWVMTREGEVLHAWEVDLDEIDRRLEGFSGRVIPKNIYPMGLALDPDGSLYATFQIRNAFPYQAAVAKLDPDGAIAWMKVDYNHHWPTLDPRGLLYAPSLELREDVGMYDDTVIWADCIDAPVYDEGVRVYSPDGEVVREYDVLRSVAESAHRGLLYSLRDGCDPLHINSVDIATEQIASQLEGVRAGDVLLSLREPSAIVLLDGETGAVKRLVSGRTAAQHAAKFLPDGRVLAFDNKGGDPELGGSRVVRIDLDAHSVDTLFPKPGETRLLPYFSNQYGAIHVSPDGARALVASGETGDIIEIDVETGELLWSMEQTLDISAYLREHRVRSDVANARFVAYGGYYVSEAALAALE